MQLAVHVDVHPMQHRPPATVLRGIVRDSQGDQRRRRLHRSRHPLERFEGARHQRLILVYVDKGAAEIEEADLALVMRGQHHRRHPGVRIALPVDALAGLLSIRQGRKHRREVVQLRTDVESQSVHVGQLHGQRRERRTDFFPIDGLGLPGVGAIAADDDLAEEGLVGIRRLAVTSTSASGGIPPLHTEPPAFNPVDRPGAVHQGITETVVMVNQVAAQFRMPGIVPEAVIGVGIDIEAAHKRLLLQDPRG